MLNNSLSYANPYVNASFITYWYPEFNEATKLLVYHVFLYCRDAILVFNRINQSKISV